MSDFVTVEGNRFWYDERGSGEPLLLLHPGGVDSRAMSVTADALAAHFHVYMFDRRGHGYTPDTDSDFTFEQAAGDTIAFIEQTIKKSVKIIGYSDGSIIALETIYRRPDLVQKAACVAGVFAISGWEDGVLQPGQEPPEFMATSYGEISPDGIDHYPVVVHKLDKMHAEGPTFTLDKLHEIKKQLLVMVGDDDEVRLEHAVDFYKALPKGELAVIPNTSHGLLVEKPDICNKILIDFMGSEPIQTFAPIRRSPQ